MIIINKMTLNGARGGRTTKTNPARGANIILEATSRLCGFTYALYTATVASNHVNNMHGCASEVLRNAKLTTKLKRHNVGTFRETEIRAMQTTYGA